MSVVAAAALAASATYALTWVAPVSVSSGAEQIATLEPVPMVDLPPGWFGAGPSSLAFEFYGMTLFETANGFTASGGTDCFVIVPTEELPAADADTANWSMSGAVHTGCGVGDFPATVQFPVDSNTPEQLRSRFPEAVHCSSCATATASASSSTLPEAAADPQRPPGRDGCRGRRRAPAAASGSDVPGAPCREQPAESDQHDSAERHQRRDAATAGCRKRTRARGVGQRQLGEPLIPRHRHRKQ